MEKGTPVKDGGEKALRLSPPLFTNKKKEVKTPQPAEGRSSVFSFVRGILTKEKKGEKGPFKLEKGVE